jgi:DNA repair protein RadA/Sms
MAKAQTRYRCSSCESISSSYLGKCPDCQEWGTFVAFTEGSPSLGQKETKRPTLSQAMGIEVKAIPLSQVTADESDRTSTGFPEMDRVLGGGIMPGGYVLIGGDPGIGKSTLMLQMAERVGLAQGKPVLYIAGEESPFQIKTRASRLGLNGEQIVVYSQTDIHDIIETIQTLKPDLVIVDSIQAIYSSTLSGTPGSVGQIRECAGLLMTVAKAHGVSIFLVGHVTKEGNVSGPKLLEHTVDAVLYFEGEKYNALRILRSVKNRFGNTQEIGVFEMAEEGLREIDSPSDLFLSETSFQNLPGSVIVATVEGSRPILVELQALVGQSTYPAPRRIANGVEPNRLHQVIAVLERRLGLDFSRVDVYVNVVGGLKIEEPAADLGVALAILASQRNLSIRFGTVVSGEIGLTGEIRPIPQGDARLNEARKIGFHRMLLPAQSAKSILAIEPQRPELIECVGVQTLMDAIREAFSVADMTVDEMKEDYSGDALDGLPV